MSGVRDFVPGSPERPRFYEFARRLMWIVSAPLFRLQVEGLENVPLTGPVILASNHLSSWDIIAVALLPPRILHFMAKAEYKKVGVLFWIFTKLEAFFVRRGEADMDAIRNCLAVLKEGQALYIFPEGHRSDTHALIPAHEGFALIAFKSGVPVIPVATWGSEKVGKGGRFGPWRPTVSVRYGTPITFTSAGKKQKREELEAATTATMRAIAHMLPRAYQGVYADDAPTAKPAPALAASDEAAL